MVGETTLAEADEQALATMMVGREVQLVVDKEPAYPGEPVLEVTDLVVADDRRQPVVDGVSFDVRAGEILALAGVQGNGQTELVEAISGMRTPASGTLRLGGRGREPPPAPPTCSRRAWRTSPRTASATGSSARCRCRQPGPQPGEGRAVRPGPAAGTAGRCAARRPTSSSSSTCARRRSTPRSSTLSGGNQQKVIIAREFFHAEHLLVCHQPTRGLDVGSIEYIHGRVVAKRDEGVAVLINSSELDEVMALADRIAVMYRGRIVGVVDRAEDNRELIGLLMAGRASRRAAEVEPVEEEEE